MGYDFEKIIERRGTNCLKWDALKQRYGNPDLLPLWVADMDWETPDFITNAIRERLEHSIFGYSPDPEDYWPTVQKWIWDHHKWDVKREWLKFIPGVVKGIGMVINVFTEKDDKVIIQPPVYHPFRITPSGNLREVVNNPLKEVRKEDGTLSYEMDFDNLSQVYDEKCKVIIISNPHNPAGIVWDRVTLEKLAHFAYTQNLIVISDEIHCDLALWGNKHIPFATVSEEAEAVSITFSAPSKTFNIAGIVSSWSVVINEELRNKFYSWLSANEFDEPTIFAPIATIAAFKNGEAWRKEMLRHVEKNIDFVMDYCRQSMPQIEVVRPEASFLVWLDCRKLGLNGKELDDLFINKAKLALNSGHIFGNEGEGFMRMNVGCPQSIIKEALDQLQKAISQ